MCRFWVMVHNDGFCPFVTKDCQKQFIVKQIHIFLQSLKLWEFFVLFFHVLPLIKKLNIVVTGIVQHAKKKKKNVAEHYSLLPAKKVSDFAITFQA